MKNFLEFIFTKIKRLTPAKWQVPAKYYFNILIRKGEQELKILNLFDLAGKKVLDVGANRGLYTYAFYLNKAQVLAFEPNPACHALLSKWAKDRNTVDCFCFALSSERSSANLFVPVDNKGVSHDAAGQIKNAENVGQTIKQEVQTFPLDELDIKDIDLIKVDVEGHEREVLDGGMDTIRQSKPILIIEIEQRHIDFPMDEIFQTLKREGYTGFFLFGKKLLSIKDFNLQKHQELQYLGDHSRYFNNFIFLHKTRIESGDYKKFLNLQA